jgi:hypothetical protein
MLRDRQVVTERDQLPKRPNANAAENPIARKKASAATTSREKIRGRAATRARERSLPVWETNAIGTSISGHSTDLIDIVDFKI